MDYISGILHLPTTDYTLLAILLVFGLGLLRFHFRFFQKLKVQPFQKTQSVPHGISVVFSAKNEYLNVKKNLEYWLEQDHDRFELVVVFDSKEEDISVLLHEMARQHPQLSLIDMRQCIEFFNDHKFFLSLGVKAAKYDKVLISNPSCYPESKDFLKMAEEGFEDRTRVVLFPFHYQDLKSKGFSPARYFYTKQQLCYLGSSLKGKSFLGNRNIIGYNKTEFLDQHAYTSIYVEKVGMNDFIGKFDGKRKKDKINVHLEANSICSTKKITHRTFLKDSYAFGKSCLHWQNPYRWSFFLMLQFHFLFHAAFIGLILNFILQNLDFQGFTADNTSLISLGYGLILFLIFSLIQLVPLSQSAKILKEKLFGLKFILYDFYTYLCLYISAFPFIFSKKKTHPKI